MLILRFLPRLPAVPAAMWGHIGWLGLSIKVHVLHIHLTHAAVKACKPPLVCKGLLHRFCCQGAAAGAGRHPCLVVGCSCLLLLGACAQVLEQALTFTQTSVLFSDACCMTTPARCAGTLARVLPHVAHGNAAAQAALLQHYAQSLDLEALDAAGAGTPQREVSSTCQLTCALVWLTIYLRSSQCERIWHVPRKHMPEVFSSPSSLQPQSMGACVQQEHSHLPVHDCSRSRDSLLEYEVLCKESIAPVSTPVALSSSLSQCLSSKWQGLYLAPLAWQHSSAFA